LFLSLIAAALIPRKDEKLMSEGDGDERSS
jgi:hypothetical protein